MCLFLSPVPMIKHIHAEKDIASYSEVPYVVGSANCILWLAYAIATPGRAAPLVTNGIGLALEAAWCGTFLAFSRGEAHTRIRARMLLMVAGIGALIVVAFAVLPALHVGTFLPIEGSVTTDLLGIMAAVFNTGMYGSPLEVMALVVRTRSVEYMPLPLTLMTMFCSCSWALYAYHVDDVFIGALTFVRCGVREERCRPAALTVVRCSVREERFAASALRSPQTRVPPPPPPRPHLHALPPNTSQASQTTWASCCASSSSRSIWRTARAGR